MHIFLSFALRAGEDKITNQVALRLFCFSIAHTKHPEKCGALAVGKMLDFWLYSYETDKHHEH